MSSKEASVWSYVPMTARAFEPKAMLRAFQPEFDGRQRRWHGLLRRSVAHQVGKKEPAVHAAIDHGLFHGEAGAPRAKRPRDHLRQAPFARRSCGVPAVVGQEETRPALAAAGITELSQRHLRPKFEQTR